MQKQSITLLLKELSAGNKELIGDIYAQLYDEIRAIAMNQINQLNTGQTITATVMANECYLKLMNQNNIKVSDKKHFLNYLAKSMRQLLIDVFRAKHSDKRQHFATSSNMSLIVGAQDINFDVLEIDQLLKKIEKINVEYCQMLEYKLIFNLTFKEISEIIDKSERQVMRLWKQATVLIMALSKDKTEEAI